MSNGTANGVTSANAHAIAAEAFVDQARSQHGDEIAELYIFGSTVRGETRGLASDVDVLIVLTEDANQDAAADSLRDIAYDVMLECGPVVELHILSEAAFERHQHEGNPFIRNVVTEGRSYA
ncbi:nucleotidyltransferase domain-containing protein [Halogeometricum luteum]|uniref:Nucleotidyltransferase domain-containing protein n=1 Tax=Halogeometricum luteum TaxID=2950537 RepID=A0ABU2G5D0_9EURY|nr:nucleotidyltransferase domain-containing protein [Halogeometricum sp. S3BR5-2]MDS0295358.1 nucleotidyltransferase domain-containing protein [Halogeometricum sp. S3BR5-2]